MVNESTILEGKFIFLLYTGDDYLERLVNNAVKDENIRVQTVESVEKFRKKQPDQQIITCIIGSDIGDPVRSAQRFHVNQKDAKIILLGKSEDHVAVLREAVKFSPFLGVDVHCLDETREEELVRRLNEIPQQSRRAEKYRAVIESTNAQLSLQSSIGQPAVNQHFINRLMDIAPIGIAVIDGNKRILGWNRKASTIFAHSEAQVLGTRLMQYFGSEEAGKLENYLERILQDSTDDRTDPISLRRTSGESSDQYLSITAASFQFSVDLGNALILAIMDITEQTMARGELEKINQTLEERVEQRTAALKSYQKQLRSLVSELSKAEEKERHRLAAELHDNLGQLLAVGKMKIDLLPKDQFSTRVSEGVEELRELLESALSYTRKLMSDLKPPPSLDDDLRSNMEWLAQKMKKHGLQVVFKDDEQSKPLSEEVQTTLIQCIRELLFNVLRHTSVDKAWVSAIRKGSQLIVAVEDKGSGFDPEEIKSAPAEESRFGLFNVQERIDLLGGKVDIHSKRDKGTKVTLYVPLEISEINPAGSSGENKPTAPGPKNSRNNHKKIKVLLVDDHRMVREGLRRIIEEEDDMMIVAEAADGKEAIDLTQKNSPDIILMDINMPGMGGIEATKRIMESDSQVRIIGLSLHDDEGVIRDMHNAGASAYLTKTEAYETLCATIRSEASLIE